MLFRHELSFADRNVGTDYRWVFCRNPVQCVKLGVRHLEPCGMHAGWLLVRSVPGSEPVFMRPSDVFAVHPDLRNNTSFEWRFNGITKDIQFAYATDVRPVVLYAASIYSRRADCTLSGTAETPFKALYSLVLVGLTYDKERDTPPFP